MTIELGKLTVDPAYQRPRLSPGELRSNAERIADAQVKERVLAGIELLNERYGPDWVDRVDLSELDLGDSTACILGQVYADAEVSEEQWEELYESPIAKGWIREDSWEEGYVRGLAILDGDVTAAEYAPVKYGFLEGGDYGDYSGLTAAWLIALGEPAGEDVEG